MSDEDDSDIELLGRWKQGDKAAGQKLVNRYFDQIRKYFTNAVDDDARNDLTQETFRKLIEAIHRFEGRSSFRTYLFQIARFTLYDFLSHQYKKLDKFDPLTHSVVDHGGVRPSSVIANVERHHAILVCMRALPVATKELLELYYWHDFTGPELAETMGIPERTVRARLSAAKKRLHECQAAGGGSDGEPDSELETRLRELGQFFESGPRGLS